MRRVSKMVLKRKLAFNRLGALGIMIGLSIFGYNSVRLTQPISFTRLIADQSITSTIKVSFNHEISRNLNYQISGGAAGSWKLDRTPLGVTAIEFHPAKPLTPADDYQITLGHLSQPWSNDPSIDQAVVTVMTETPAAIDSIWPAASQVNVPISSDVVVTLKSPNKGLRHLTLISSAPLKSAEPTSSDDRHFSWHFTAPLVQGQHYQLELDDANQTAVTKRRLAISSFTTVTEPQIVSATQTDHLYPGNTVTVGFDQAMKPSQTSITTSMPGSGHWQDPKTYLFSPTGLVPGQSYSYTIHKGATSTVGGVTQADHSYTVAPPGHVVVTGQSPHGGNVALASSISFTFDQPVDHASAQAHFSLSPALAGTFSWAGNTMTYHPSQLDYQSGYTASLSAGISGTFGLPSSQAFNNGFTTTYQVTKLNVPYFTQAYGLSCEEAALRMALAFRGINTTDFDIVGRVGYAPRPRDTGTNTWDDPYQMFVGDINGAQNSTGYGVYGPPIAKAAQSYGRNATASSGVSASYIAQQVIAGNPVVAWGYVHTPHADSWNSPDGVIAAYTGEHARTIYGVAGQPDNIVGFYIHDPIYGNLFWSAGQLMSNMNAFGNTSNQVVVVF